MEYTQNSEREKVMWTYVGIKVNFDYFGHVPSWYICKVARASSTNMCISDPQYVRGEEPVTPHLSVIATTPPICKPSFPYYSMQHSFHHVLIT